MTSANNKKDAFSQLDELTDKRSALENLIDIAIGIHRQQLALEGQSLIARPSQEIPASSIHNVQEIEQQHAGMADEKLIQRLDSIEQGTHKVIEMVAMFAQLKLHELRNNEVKGLSIDAFKNLISDFEQRTQASLELRYLLKKRGVVLKAFKLPFPQESISELVQALKEKEDQCVTQIKEEAKGIIEDTRSLLAKPTFSDKMKQQLLLVQQEMEANLAHLDSGASVATIPNKFEVIVVQSDAPAGDDGHRHTPLHEPPRRPSKPKTTKEAKPKARAEQTEAKEHKPEKKLSTFRLLVKWLTTPLSTSWKSLKEDNDKKEL
ncbi:MAG: hypothetical protein V7739_15110 [Motiliproteus sp.]